MYDVPPPTHAIPWKRIADVLIKGEPISERDFNRFAQQAPTGSLTRAGFGMAHATIPIMACFLFALSTQSASALIGRAARIACRGFWPTVEASTMG